MSAFLKVYTDNAHTNEVAHTTTATATFTGTAGDTSITLSSATGWDNAGYIDIIDGTNGNETIQFISRSGTTIQLATALAHNHPAGTTVNEWAYTLDIGDQTNGIANDGSASTPVAANTATWYLYNAGGQTAQSPTLATSNASPSTANGFSDTLISITSSSTGFATSVAPANIAAGSQQQFWVCAEIPSGQNGLPTNPQQCLININYSSI